MRLRRQGFTLIELAIGLVLLGVLLVLALPNFTVFVQNAQIRNAGESVLQGLSLARAEALRRNTTVRFQFVSSLTSGCTLSTGSLAWVISRGDPTGLCDVAPAGQADASAPTSADPKIVQKQSATEGTQNVLVTASSAVASFNGLGRMTGTAMTSVDLRNSSGACEHEAADGTMRCLRVMIDSGGAAKLCDPKIGDNTDPRHCS